MARIKNRAQFQSVLSHATCARTAHFALHVLPLTAAIGVGGTGDLACADDAEGEDARTRKFSGDLFPQGGAWLGAMVPKRWARRAVTRNAIRRQIYAVASSDGPPPSVHADVAWVVRLRAEFSRKQFLSASSDALKTAVRDELRQLWSRTSRP